MLYYNYSQKEYFAFILMKCSQLIDKLSNDILFFLKQNTLRALQLDTQSQFGALTNTRYEQYKNNKVNHYVNFFLTGFKWMNNDKYIMCLEIFTVPPPTTRERHIVKRE